MHFHVPTLSSVFNRRLRQLKPKPQPSRLRIDKESLQFNRAGTIGPQAHTTPIGKQHTLVLARQTRKLFLKCLKAQIHVNIGLIIAKDLPHRFGIFREARLPDVKLRFTWVQRPKIPFKS